jgi:hypothetical protein
MTTEDCNAHIIFSGSTNGPNCPRMNGSETLRCALNCGDWAAKTVAEERKAKRRTRPQKPEDGVPKIVLAICAHATRLGRVLRFKNAARLVEERRGVDDVPRRRRSGVLVGWIPSPCGLG